MFGWWRHRERKGVYVRLCNKDGSDVTYVNKYTTMALHAPGTDEQIGEIRFKHGEVIIGYWGIHMNNMKQALQDAIDCNRNYRKETE
jgi:hypothetical protein